MTAQGGYSRISPAPPQRLFLLCKLAIIPAFPSTIFITLFLVFAGFTVPKYRTFFQESIVT